MKEYEKNSPLIGLHIPKTAGISTRVIFQKWFAEGFFRHYFDENTGEMPRRYDFQKMSTNCFLTPTLIYGHFNGKRGFGVQDYYPEANQFITIMRDPFEQKISSYFFIKKVSGNWVDQSRTPTEGIENFLLNTNFNMLNHFPRKVTKENYKEIIEKYFIEIGVTEHLDLSMTRIAQKLGFQYDQSMLQVHNSTLRDEEVPIYLRDVLEERNELEFTVYKYVLQKFKFK